MGIYRSVKAGLMVASVMLSANSWAACNDLSRVGDAELNWLFFKVYDAELRSPSGTHRTEEERCLELTYAMSITRDDLLESTNETLRELQFASADIDRWLAHLDDIYRDVESGDRFSVRVSSTGLADFYLNSVPAGSVDDPTFGHAFLAIWLSDNGRYPKLAKRLKGES
jgi:hypothetical protein